MEPVYKIVTELKKKPDDPWVTMYETSYSYFTQDQIDDIIIPFKEYAASLPGMITDLNTAEMTDANTLILTTVFDSEEHARDASHKLSKLSEIPVVQARNALFSHMLKLLNIKYDVVKYFDFPGQDRIIIE